MGLVWPEFRYCIIGGRIAVVEGRDLLPLRQGIGAVVNVSAQPVQRADTEARPYEALEDAEHRQGGRTVRSFDRAVRDISCYAVGPAPRIEPTRSERCRGGKEGSHQM